MNVQTLVWVALPLTLGLAHCSSTSGDGTAASSDITGSDPSPTDGTSDGTTPSTVGSGSSSSGSSTKDAGAAKGAGAAGKGSTGSGSTGPGSTDAGAGPAADSGILPAPPAGTGVQVTSGILTVPPGAEIFKCKMIAMPTSVGAVKVGNFVSYMSPGSHHVILNVASSAEAVHADGDLWDCPASGGQWVYASSSPENHLDMPPNVGLPFDSGEKLVLNMHYVNPSSKPLDVQVWINIGFAVDVKYDAGVLASFNWNISIPPQSSKTFGSQCKAAIGSKFFALSTHTHKYATSTTIDYVSGGARTPLVDTTDWQHPDSKTWTSPDFLTIKSGDYFEEKCNYTNTTGGLITVGETALSNEMCMQVGYYFPAPAGQQTGLANADCTYF